MKQDSDIKNDNKTFLANLRKILIIGSLLIVAMIAIIFLNVGVVIFFIGLGLGASSGGESFLELVGAFLLEMIKLFFSPEGILLYWLIPVLGVWLFYFMTVLLTKIYSLFGTNLKRKINTFSKWLGKILIAIVVVVVICIGLYIVVNIGNINISRVFDSPPDYGVYDSTSYCFLYHNKFYYLGKEESKNVLYKLDFSGFLRKRVSSKHIFDRSNFYMVYDNEAYFYSPDDMMNKKINLSTKKITNLNNTYNYIGKTLNIEEGTIYAFDNIDDFNERNDYSIYMKIDLKNNQVISNHKCPKSIDNNSNVMFEYENGDIYMLIKPFNGEHPVLYKNDDIIYQFEEYNNNDFPELTFILSDKEYIYYIQNDCIYKLNTNNGEIVKTTPLKYKNIKRIDSGNNKDNFFYANERIYSYNFEKDDFDFIIPNVSKQPEKVYHINNTLIFTENVDNIHELKNDNLGSVLIYDTISKTTNNIDKVRKASFDEEKMYVIIQKKVGRFKIKTYNFKDFS